MIYERIDDEWLNDRFTFEVVISMMLYLMSNILDKFEPEKYLSFLYEFYLLLFLVKIVLLV